MECQGLGCGGGPPSPGPRGHSSHHLIGSRGDLRRWQPLPGRDGGIRTPCNHPERCSGATAGTFSRRRTVSPGHGHAACSPGGLLVHKHTYRTGRNAGVGVHLEEANPCLRRSCTEASHGAAPRPGPRGAQQRPSGCAPLGEGRQCESGRRVGHMCCWGHHRPHPIHPRTSFVPCHNGPGPLVAADSLVSGAAGSHLQRPPNDPAAPLGRGCHPSRPLPTIPVRGCAPVVAIPSAARASRSAISHRFPDSRIRGWHAVAPSRRLQLQWVDPAPGP
mmetsp:Transcript_104562/g.180183  ORF Transcript_104562/g.180183 Transcript_104562/m.180183 type:complete len:275 (+) Transcript_104562:620-1444(+)